MNEISQKLERNSMKNGSHLRTELLNHRNIATGLVVPLTAKKMIHTMERTGRIKIPISFFGNRVLMGICVFKTKNVFLVFLLT